MAAQHYFRFMTSKSCICCRSNNLSLVFCRAFAGFSYPLALLAFTFLLSACATQGSRQIPKVENGTTLTPSQESTSATPSSNETQSTADTQSTTNHTVTNLESGLTRFGTIQPAGVTEASGMAFSGLQSNLLWLINDSGNQAILFAVTTRGNTVASYEIAADNRDWEDLAQLNVNGESFLLIFDIGDNLRNQNSYRLHLLPEPIPDTRRSATTDPALQPLISFELTYEDGAHNAEAAAVADDGMLYIITKDNSPAVYMAPIREAINSATTGSSITSNGQAVPLMATRIGSFRQPTLTATDSLINLITGVALNAITALDVDNNLGEAWFTTYRGIYKLPSTVAGGWPAVLLSKPVKFADHGLKQAEAMAVSPNSEGVFATSEGRAAPLLRLVP